MEANPFSVLIDASENDPVKIQEAYHLHRTTRFENQRKKLLDVEFKSFDIDPILSKLLNPDKYPGYKDPRHVLVFWARPTAPVKHLVSLIQEKLRAKFPSIWPLPQEGMHSTVMEIAHSKTEPEIAALISGIQSGIQQLADWTYDHRARLIKPSLGFDASAIALTWLPAAGEAIVGHRIAKDDEYSYHHLRRDVYEGCNAAGAHVQSRYIVNTSHITVGRFTSEVDFLENVTPGEKVKLDSQKVRDLVLTIEEINTWLETEYWPKADSNTIKEGGEWLVGEGLGLELRKGTAWYGGGERVTVGKGY